MSFWVPFGFLLGPFGFLLCPFGLLLGSFGSFWVNRRAPRTWKCDVTDKNRARSKVQKRQISRASIVVWVSRGKFRGSKKKYNSRSLWIRCIKCAYLWILPCEVLCVYIYYVRLLSFSRFVLYMTFELYLYVCLHLFFSNACFVQRMKDSSAWESV